MNTIDSKFKISNNKLNAVGKVSSTKRGDNFAKLIKSGLTTNTAISEHMVWQTYNVMFENPSTSELSKAQFIAILPTVSDALKAYRERIKEAVFYGLIEEPNNIEEKGAYTKS